MVVQVGVRRLRSKTVQALVGHVIQTLPTSAGEYCEPLIRDYFKLLRIVLEYQPHPEHFKKGEWHQIAEFLNEVISDLNDVLDENESSLSHRLRDSNSFQELSSRATTPNGRNHSLSKPSNPRFGVSGKESLKASAEDILRCARYLHSIPNGPITENAGVRLQNLLDFLRLSPNASHTQQAAFDCINYIIVRIVSDDIGLAQDTLKALIPIACRFWQLKSGPMKDSILTFLLYGETHLKHIIQSDGGADFSTSLEDLLEAFREDYCKRPDREQLQSEDLEMTSGPLGQQLDDPLQLQAFKVRFGAKKSEQPWAMLQISTSIISALDRSSRSYRTTSRAEDDDHISKRLKISSALNNVLLGARALQAAEKLHAIQLIAFLAAQPMDDRQIFQGYLDVLLSCVADANSVIVSWAMLAMSR